MKPIITVFVKEILDSLRDRRTLFTAVLMPILLMPAIMVGSFKLQEAQVKKAQEKVITVAVSGAEYAPSLTTFLAEQENTKVEEAAADYREAIKNGTSAVAIEVPSDYEQYLLDTTPVPLTVLYKSSDVDSSTAFTRVSTLLQAYNQTVGVDRLQARGLSPSLLQAVLPVTTDVSTPEERGGFFLGLLLPMFIVLFSIIGGMYIAIDVSAGEKERKTLEALLYAPVRRIELVMGKFLAVASTASVTIILSLASLYAGFKLFPPPSFDGGGQIAVNLSLGSVGIMLGIGVILAIMFSGMLLSVAIFAKSYKEAQNYISPFYLLAILPISIVSTIPGFKPPLLLFLAPGMNAVFVMKEVLLGVYDTGHILITAGSLFVFAALAIVISTYIYSREGVLFRD